MRSSLVRVGSQLRKTQVLQTMPRMMGTLTKTESEALTKKERVAVFKLDMDALPVPYGDWATEYGKAQLKYNLHLLVSLALMIGAYYFYRSRKYIITVDKTSPINLEEIYLQRKALMQEEEE